MDSALLVHRLHFAFTVTFHYLFPQLTMGLAPLIVVLKTLALRRKDETYNQAARFWAQDLRHQLRARRGDRHSHGISVRHQLVALLALCRWRDRADAGHGRHVRVLPGIGIPRAFSLRREAAEPAGALVVGGGCVSGLVAFRLLHYCHRCLDAASGGLRKAADGSVQLSSFWELVLNPWAWWQYAHNMSGAVITGAFVMASVGAFYLLWGKLEEHGRIFVRVGRGCGIDLQRSAAFSHRRRAGAHGGCATSR